MSADEKNSEDQSTPKWKEKKYNNEEKYNEMIRILAKAEKDCNLVIFIGAGVSISQGYPNWDGYVDHLIKYWQFNIQSLPGQERVTRETILVFDKIAKGKYSNKRKIDLVHQVLKELLGDTFEEYKLKFEKYYFDEVISFDPENEILASLSDLDATFITPNYDLEIERHLKRKRNTISVIPDLKMFAFASMDQFINPVLHIHGTASGSPSWLINSSSAYSRQYFRRRKYFEALVKWFETTKPVVLFVGVSLEEDELLSLLIKDNKNYALMKADVSSEKEVDSHLRKYTEKFFEQENHTEIFWYGDDFDDLPEVVKDLVTDIKGKNLYPKQVAFWNRLTKLETSKEEYIKTLNILVNDNQYHRTLHEFFGHIFQVKEQSLIKKVLECTFLSDIILDDSTYVPETLWELLERHYDELNPDQRALVLNLYTQKSFDQRYTSAYEVYKKISIDPTIKAKIVASISSLEYLPMTDYFNDPEITAQWLINQFSKKHSSEHLYILNEDTVKFNFSPGKIRELHFALNNEIYNGRYLYQIDRMINRGIVGIFYRALKDNRLLIDNKKMIDNFPNELLEIKLIQKILVYLSIHTKLPDELIGQLISKIDFDNRLFGSELNQFIEIYRESVGHIFKPYEGEYTDVIKDLEPIEIDSFITSEDVLRKDAQDIVSTLVNSKDYFEDDYSRSIDSFKTVDATIDFILRSLQEDSRVSDKLQTILKEDADELFNRYENLYLKIAIDETIYPELSVELKTIFLNHIDKNHYTANYDTFFSNLLLRKSESDDKLRAAFLDINVAKLSYSNDQEDLKDFIEFVNTELGSYTWNLVRLLRSEKIKPITAKEKISQIKVDALRNFAEGALLEHYNVDELNITKNTFLGFCYFPSYSDLKLVFPHFKSIVIDLLENNMVPDNLEKIPFHVALYEIDPGAIKIAPNNKFRFMLATIFINNKTIKFEKEWIKWIIENDPDGTSLNELSYIFGLEKLSISKIQKFMDCSDDFLRNGDSKTSLPVFTHKLKEDKLTVSSQLFITLIFKLLHNERVRTDLYFAEELEKLMVYLKKEEKIELLNIQYVVENLTPLEIQRLRGEI